MKEILLKLQAFWRSMGWNFEEHSTVIAVSGGKDSMLLVSLFKELKLPFSMAHVNFKLRGKESDEDAQFILEHAHENGIPVYTTELAAKKEKEKNTQLAARKLRYQWFAQLCATHKFDYIATAHHLQDSIETQFINMGRGTGLAGMLGIPAYRDNIVRPLANLSPKEVDLLVTALNVKWREDSSNASNTYVRNKIRHDVIPKLDEIFPSYFPSQLQNFIHLNSDKKLIDELVEIYRKKVLSTRQDISIYNLKIIEDHAERNSLLYYLLIDWNFNSVQIRQIWYSYYKEDGAIFLSSLGKATLRNNELQVAQNRSIEQREIIIDQQHKIVSLENGTLQFSEINPPENFLNDKNLAVVDKDKLTWPLRIRYWKKGDSFQPFGMKGKHQKLQDFFSNNKYSILEKERQALLYSGNEIIWIIGQRLAASIIVEDSTTSCLQITWIAKED